MRLLHRGSIRHLPTLRLSTVDLASSRVSEVAEFPGRFRFPARGSILGLQHEFATSSRSEPVMRYKLDQRLLVVHWMSSVDNLVCTCLHFSTWVSRRLTRVLEIAMSRHVATRRDASDRHRACFSFTRHPTCRSCPDDWFVVERLFWFKGVHVLHVATWSRHAYPKRAQRLDVASLSIELVRRTNSRHYWRP